MTNLVSVVPISLFIIVNTFSLILFYLHDRQAEVLEKAQIGLFCLWETELSGFQHSNLKRWDFVELQSFVSKSSDCLTQYTAVKFLSLMCTYDFIFCSLWCRCGQDNHWSHQESREPSRSVRGLRKRNYSCRSKSHTV